MDSPLPSVPSSVASIDVRAVARDLWPLGTLEVWTGGAPPTPARVFWPSTAAEVLAVLKAAAAAAVPVVTWGAGSGVCGGARAIPGCWVLDTKGLGAIGPLDPERLTVRVEAGVNGQQLEDWLAQRGFTLGHSPSSIACSTVGGWAAARSAGQFSSRYGVFEDQVLALTFASPGEGVRTVGEGGDAPAEWMPLLLGSEGTLGVVTSALLRVWPAPRARWLRGYRLPDVGTAVRAMRELLQAEVHPAAVRLYDPVDTRIGGRTKPRPGRPDDDHPSRGFLERWLAAADALPGVRRRSLALPLALPGLVNRLLDGVAGGCLLVVGFEGPEDVVKVASEVGHGLVARHGDDLGAGPGERWFHSRHAVSYKLMPVFERGGFADTMEVACRWSLLEPTWRAVRRALAPHAVVMAHFSHLYPEGGSIYFSFAGKGDLDTYRTATRAALRAALDAGATTTHHHGVGELKAAYAREEVGAAIAGWHAAKARFDPEGVLNPGRLFTADPVRDAPAAPLPDPTDGLGPPGPEAAFATELPGPPRWQRMAWQVPWTELDGTVDGHPVRLGRGPRSATGPDLRDWLFREGTDVRVRVPWAAAGARVMGRVVVEAPWGRVRELLRRDLRPSVTFVREGALYVGFRGPAASRWLATAAAVLPGLEPVPYEVVPVPAALVPCADDDPRAVHATPQSAFRPSAPAEAE